MTMKRTIQQSLIVAAVLFAGVSLNAQEVDRTPFLPKLVLQVLDYTARNGTISSGWAVSADGTENGVLLSQSVSIEALRIQFRKTELVPGFQHSTLFSVKDGQPDRDLLGINVRWHWFSMPPWVKNIETAPVVRSVVFPKLFSEWELKPSVNYRTDYIARGKLDWRGLYLGIEVAYKF
jgi:hypothetical protein